MLTSYMSYTAEEKLKIIEYSCKYGIEQTLEALALDSSRRLSKATLCRWRKIWRKSCEVNYGVGNPYDLKDKSKKPLRLRESKVNTQILQFIQSVRLQYPTLGKDKLKVLVDQFCLENRIKTISTSTIGRIISTFKQHRIIPKWTTKESKKVGLHGGTGK